MPPQLFLLHQQISKFSPHGGTEKMWNWTNLTRFTYIWAILIVSLLTVYMIFIIWKDWAEIVKDCKKTCTCCDHEPKPIVDRKLGTITVRASEVFGGAAILANERARRAGVYAIELEDY